MRRDEDTAGGADAARAAQHITGRVALATLWGDPPPPDTDDVFELWAYDFRMQYERSKYAWSYAFRFPCFECSADGSSCCGHDPQLGPSIGLAQWWAQMIAHHGRSVIACRVCEQPVETPQRAMYQHDACLTCPVCGDYPMRGDQSERPGGVKCWECVRRAQQAEDEAVRRADDERYENAAELLRAGAGTREEREAALIVVGDYHLAMGCS